MIDIKRFCEKMLSANSLSFGVITRATNLFIYLLQKLTLERLLSKQDRKDGYRRNLSALLYRNHLQICTLTIFFNHIFMLGISDEQGY